MLISKRFHRAKVLQKRAPCDGEKVKAAKHHNSILMSGSSSSSSDDDSSSSSSASSNERKKRHKRTKEKKEKKRRKHGRKRKHDHGEQRKTEKHKKRHKKEKAKREKSARHPPVERSIITGKRLKREARDDAEGNARRQAILASMNEGEDEEAAQTFASSSSAPTGGVSTAAAELAQKALADPAYMLELMRKSNEMQAAKRARLGALMGTAAPGAGLGGAAGPSLEEATRIPRNYKQERAAREREEL